MHCGFCQYFSCLEYSNCVSKVSIALLLRICVVLWQSSSKYLKNMILLGLQEYCEMIDIISFFTCQWYKLCLHTNKFFLFLCFFSLFLFLFYFLVVKPIFEMSIRIQTLGSSKMNWLLMTFRKSAWVAVIFGIESLEKNNAYLYLKFSKRQTVLYLGLKEAW